MPLLPFFVRGFGLLDTVGLSFNGGFEPGAHITPNSTPKSIGSMLRFFAVAFLGLLARRLISGGVGLVGLVVVVFCLGYTVGGMGKSFDSS